MGKSDKQLLDCFDDSLSGLIFWAFRYFVGRRTIHTCCFARDLATAWPFLSEEIKHLIERDLERDFEFDDNSRASGLKFRTLGHDCDRAAWELVRACWKKESE